MNHKLKKQLTTAVLILIGLFVLFAIVGQIAWSEKDSRKDSHGVALSSSY